MWRNHSREYYILVFGTVAMVILLTVGVGISFWGISIIADIFGNVTKSDTHVTFKLDNKRELIEQNTTIIGASYYSVPNATEFAAMTLNTTYICEIHVHDPGWHILARNNTISNCTVVG